MSKLLVEQLLIQYICRFQTKVIENPQMKEFLNNRIATYHLVVYSEKYRELGKNESTINIRRSNDN